MILLEVGVAHSIEENSYPFRKQAIGSHYTVFLAEEGVNVEDIEVVFADEMRCWFSLGERTWQDMIGQVQGIYDVDTGNLMDLRFIVFSNTFDSVVAKLKGIYSVLDAVDYVNMDLFFREYPDWLSVMSSRLERRIASEQLALFKSPLYRIEVWNESFSQMNPSVLILFRVIE